jgi:NADPH:quinone reductase-like Zn-dependent oxidoreductase
MKLRYKIANGLIITLALATVAFALVLSHNSDCEPVPSISGEKSSMKAIVAQCYGSPDVLEFVDIAKPVPADNEVLVKVHAASVNPLDWHFLRGTPYVIRLFSGLGTPNDPGVGVDFSGTVEAVGKDVTRYKVGDEVFGGGDGAFAEYVLKEEDSHSFVLKPDNVSHDQAAAVPIAGLTALQALRDSGKLKAGETVLINGASGGVGTLAVQIAKSFGAEVTGVCSTRNLDMVLSIGADHVIDYKKDNYTQKGLQYDLIIDMVGNHSISDNLKALKPEGRMVMVGGAKGNWIAPFLGEISARLWVPFIDQEIVGILSKFNSDDLNTLGELMRTGELDPVIGSRFELAATAEAIRHSEQGHARGKIIIDIN